MEKIRVSLGRFGAFKPILVRTLRDGTLEILGGEHRTACAVDMGIEQVPIVNFGELSDRDAKEIGLVDNGRYGSDDTLGLAQLLEDLGNREELASFLPYTDAEFDSIFSATTIDLDGLEVNDEPLRTSSTPSPKAIQTHTTMKFRVRVEDAQRVSDQLNAVMRSQGFSKDTAEVNAGDALIWLVGRSAE